MNHPPANPSALPREPLFLALSFDRFPAQAIAAWDPAYAGRSYVVVRQAAAESLAVVLAASPWVSPPFPPAGMPLHELRRRYPGMEIVPRSEAFEAAARAELARLYERHTPVFSIGTHGASLLDLTATPAQRSGVATAITTLTREIRQAVGLPLVAAGAGTGPLVARIMAQSARPAGTMVCPAGNEEAMLDRLDLRHLPGLSTACRERLAKYGLRSAGQVRRIGRSALARRFGAEGELLYALTGGTDARVMAPPSPAVVAETTLDRDTNDTGLLRHTVRLCADRLCHELRCRDQAIERMTVTLVYRDNRSVQKTMALGHATDDFTVIAGSAERCFSALHTRRVGIRTIRLCAKKPDARTGQLSLFETVRDEKLHRVGETITDVRRRMSFGALCSASDLAALHEQRRES